MNGDILIFDDDPDNLRALEQILTADGCKVRVAVNGEAALRSVGECPPDLILFGISMPGMDGLELCRRLKGDTSTAAIPLLFISALPESGEKLSAFAAGCDDCISKPFAGQELLARVRTHLGLAREMTERKRVEEELFQAQKMETIGRLAAGVVHDFNNILTVIAGYGQIMRENIDSGNSLLQESVAQILNSSERAAELIRGLLAFRRKRVIDPLPVQIDSLIVNTGKLIQRVIGEDIEFCTSFVGNKLYVMADAGQIEQVLMALAARARAAMPRGGRMAISTMRVMVKEGSEAIYGLSAAGEYAVISVAVSGAVIEEKPVGRNSRQIYASKEAGKEGALGLSMVHGIIRQHKGGVTIRDEAGSGTVFDIYLPLVYTSAAREESKKPQAIAGGTETILVAEDEIIVREYLKSLLERAGYRVVVAEDGEEAVAMFEEHDDISLVLSDVVMPKKNGVEILKEIKKRKPGIKMIFISGYSADAIRKMGNFEEDVDYIAKPFDKSRILSKIRGVLDQQ